MNAAYEFLKAIQTAGLTPPEIMVPDGKLHRFASNGKRGDDAGWYVFHDDGIPGGSFGDWRTGSSQTWRADVGRDLTPAELAAHQARVDSARRARHVEEARRRAAAAKTAVEIWKSAQPAPGDHLYLVRKRVTAHGLRLYRGSLVVKGMPCDGSLIVPACDGSGAIHTLEFIHPETRDGDNKRFLPGGDPRGYYFSIGTMEGAGPLCLCEGYATGASIHEPTGYPSVVCFNAGNLEPVAKAMRERFPDSRLIVCADDDAATTCNPGLTKATAAALAVGGLLAVPDFGEDRPEGLKDFNDLAVHRGREALRRAIASAKAPSGAPGDAEVIESAIAKLVTDIGAVFEPEVITALKAVRESNPADYQRYRKRIKDAGASVAELDRLVCAPEEKGDGAQGAPVLFPDIEPWPEPVDGAELLADLAATFKRYTILPDLADVALALWAILTHCIDAVNIAPILALTSPEKRCGKSTVLALIGRLALRSLPVANISGPSLFRAVEAWSPALLIDEADTFLRNNDELRGVINSGHTRDSAFVIRTVGDDHEPRKFSTWGAKAIASIGKLSDTNADRSIEICLKRKLPGERTEKLRHADPETFNALARRCARWAADHIDEIRAARPSMPAGLHDRAEDNWEPLLAIADLAGGEWPKRARQAATALSGAVDAENDTLRVQLLSDIRKVFTSENCDRFRTVALIEALIAIEGRPWGEVNRGKPANARWIAARLRPFGIVPGSKRKGEDTFKGYVRDQFADAFRRYLPPPSPEDPPSDRSHRHNVGTARVSEDSASVTKPQCDGYENHPEPSPGAGCDGVTDPRPPSWGVRL